MSAWVCTMCVCTTMHTNLLSDSELLLTYLLMADDHNIKVSVLDGRKGKAVGNWGTQTNSR